MLPGRAAATRCARSSSTCAGARWSTTSGALRAKHARGLGLTVAVRRRQRHGQDDGGRDPRRRARPRSVPGRSRLGREQVDRRDREEPARDLRRGRSAAARSCCSTRPTRCSASAARSATATTATPTSRSATCCSRWRPIAASRSSPRTCSTRSTRRSCGGSASSSSSRSPTTPARAEHLARASSRRRRRVGDLDFDAARAAQRGRRRDPQHRDARAPFLAAEDATRVAGRHILAAARTEYAKLDKPLTPAETRGLS